MLVFTKLNKLEEAFEFLTAAECKIKGDSFGYRSAVASIIEHVVKLPKSEIESKFLSQTFTERQEAEISDYLKDVRPNLKLIQLFWSRRPVQAVGLAIKLNWEEQKENA